jgi:hypothetical protein
VSPAGRRALVIVAALTAVAVAGCGNEDSTPEAGPATEARAGPTCATLRASSDPESDAYMPLIDIVYESEQGNRSTYDALTGGQQMLWATMLLEGEVNNGGFNQYFFNTEGMYLEDAIRGFETFGSPAHAKLARQARNAYTKDRERINDARDKGHSTRSQIPTPTIHTTRSTPGSSNSRHRPDGSRT